MTMKSSTPTPFTQMIANLIQSPFNIRNIVRTRMERDSKHAAGSPEYIALYITILGENDATYWFTCTSK